MWKYDVTEEKARETSAILKSRKEKPKSSSAYKVDKQLKHILSGIRVDRTSEQDFSQMSHEELKQLFESRLKDKPFGLGFSPYLEGQNIGDILSEEQIERRMEIIAPYTHWVRSFSCTEGNEYIPKVAHDKGLKTMVGAWIDGDKAKNEQEINNLIRLAQDGKVNIAIIGNEVLLRNDLTENEILDYIHRVKAALPNIPVGYVDAYYQFYENPRLVEACDVIAVNCYPFWEGCNINEASTYLKQMYALTQQVAKGKPVIIAETGWPSEGSNVGNAEPSPANAMKYFINTINWQKEQNIELFYFSSFDESWKVHHEGDVGERWGIWSKHEKLKF